MRSSFMQPPAQASKRSKHSGSPSRLARSLGFSQVGNREQHDTYRDCHIGEVKGRPVGQIDVVGDCPARIRSARFPSAPPANMPTATHIPDRVGLRAKR